MVRELMLGEEGVLQSPESRQALVDALMMSWLKHEEGDQGAAVLRNILMAVMEGNSPERVYQYTSGVLQSLMLRPPKEQSPIEGIAERKAREIVDSLVSKNKVQRLMGTEYEAVRQKILNLMKGARQGEDEGDLTQEMHDRLMAVFALEQEEQPSSISSSELALIAGKNSMAIGVRMLQLAGQWYEIPEAEREKYDEVYDSMKGQTRLQAYRVLQREAQFHPETAALLDEIAVFGKRLGGGSLMTVYEIILKDGQRQVLGVRNPNAEYHVVQVADVAVKSLDIASSRDPGNLDLGMARSLVLDAVQWIGNELGDTNFHQKDEVFRRENDTTTGNGFARGKSKYDIYVPKTEPTGTLWLRREELVEGENLKNLKVVDEPTDIATQKINREDYKQVVSSLVRNTFFQLKQGKFLHPDAHGGNYRVTTDNTKIAIFDRYNLIPVTPELRECIEQATSNLAAGNRHAASVAIIRYVVDDSGDADAFAARIAPILDETEDTTEAMLRSMIELKKAGLEVPINLSLTLRNVFSMTKLSAQAGFASIVEAFLHTATDDEIAAFGS